MELEAELEPEAPLEEAEAVAPAEMPEWLQSLKPPEEAAPRQAAKLVDPQMTLPEVINLLIKAFDTCQAPPRYERAVNVQEVETILCKWKSHQHGHYPVGKDLHEVDKHLKGWGNLARRLRSCLP